MPPEDQTELAFLMVKPDGVKRRLIGEIIRRIESTDLELVAARLVFATTPQAARHYQRKRDGSSGFTMSQAVSYLTSGAVFTTIWRGHDAVATLRALVGSKADPHRCAPGTIRFDFAKDSLDHANKEQRAVRNVVHSSHDPLSALSEIEIWFGDYLGGQHE